MKLLATKKQKIIGLAAGLVIIGAISTVAIVKLSDRKHPASTYTIDIESKNIYNASVYDSFIMHDGAQLYEKADDLKKVVDVMNGMVLKHWGDTDKAYNNSLKQLGGGSSYCEFLDKDGHCLLNLKSSIADNYAILVGDEYYEMSDADSDKISDMLSDIMDYCIMKRQAIGEIPRITLDTYSEELQDYCIVVDCDMDIDWTDADGVKHKSLYNTDVAQLNTLSNIHKGSIEDVSLSFCGEINSYTVEKIDADADISDGIKNHIIDTRTVKPVDIKDYELKFDSDKNIIYRISAEYKDGKKCRCAFKVTDAEDDYGIGCV